MITTFCLKKYLEAKRNDGNYCNDYLNATLGALCWYFSLLLLVFIQNSSPRQADKRASPPVMRALAKLITLEIEILTLRVLWPGSQQLSEKGLCVNDSTNYYERLDKQIAREKEANRVIAEFIEKHAEDMAIVWKYGDGNGEVCFIRLEKSCLKMD